jgi:formylglycine-generating enzyme required for sulfatase activity
MIRDEPEENEGAALAPCGADESTLPWPSGAPAADAGGDPVSELDIAETLRLLDEIWPREAPRPGQITRQFGRFSILRELGRGGFGVVYLAEDPLLGRKVALKLPRIEPLSRGEAWGRFMREARAAARLDHPNLIPLLEAGSMGPLIYIVSVFVPGPSLDEWLRCNRGGASPRWAARVVADLARGIGHAHSRGILHRDLKPANVLLHVPDCDGEAANRLAWEEDRPERWTPRICDFGLAGLQEIEGGESQSRGACGSAPYMAPEQAEARQDEIGPATDVYGLGAILYELLTGRPPFAGASDLETLRQVTADEPAQPRRLRPGLPRDLETICLKCLSKRPTNRYRGARALSEDLERFLGGLPIQARPPTPWSVAWRWCRRNFVLATSAASAAMIVIALFCAAVFWWNQVSVAAATARAKVEMLAKAETANVPEIVAQLAPLRPWADPLLYRMARESPEGSKAALHCELALLGVDRGRVKGLVGWLRRAETRPQELLVITEALIREGHASSIAALLWSELDGISELSDGQLRKAGAVAGFDPENPRWRALAGPVAARLVRENPLLLGLWRDIYRRVGRWLFGPMLEFYYDRRQRAERVVAEGFLLDIAARSDNNMQAADYADLMIDADLERFEQLLAIVNTHDRRGQAIDRLLKNLEMPDDGDEGLAARQGRSAVALVRLGRNEPAWRLLGRDVNPGAGTELIHNLVKCGVDPLTVSSRLAVERDVRARRGLVLALGEYGVARIPDAERRALTTKLLDDYRYETNAGLHSAIDWLLRQAWGCSADVDQIDRACSAREAAGGYEWYVSPQSDTFSVVRGPVEFQMGSPADEPGRYPDETRHRVRIERTFAIATREVTLGQYMRFVGQNPGADRGDLAASVSRLSPTLRHPAIKVDWYCAARYCNWLSQQEGIPRSQWCYPPEINDQMTLPVDCLDRTGYRLPTEAEWEYACRAGSIRSRPEGIPNALLSKYAWYKTDNAAHKQHCEVGRLMPNTLGLFDMLGNVWEWVHDSCVDPYAGGTEPTATDTDPGGLVTNALERVLRGGASDCNEPYLRSAMRNRRPPNSRYGSDGFRVARTLKEKPSRR